MKTLAPSKAIVGVIDVILAAAAAFASTLPAASNTTPVVQSRNVAALSYPVRSAEMRNHWLIAAATWPAVPSSGSQAKPSKDQASRFARLTRDILNSRWAPRDFTSVPYLKAGGLVYVAQNDRYRLRLREEEIPAVPGSDSKSRCMLIAVEQLSDQAKSLPAPVDFLASLGEFLNQNLVLDPAAVKFVTPTGTFNAQPGKKLPAVSKRSAGGVFIAYWPTKTVPDVIPYAWTDGRITLIAIDEDDQIYIGPLPTPRPPHPVPPPPLGEEHRQ